LFFYLLSFIFVLPVLLNLFCQAYFLQLFYIWRFGFGVVVGGINEYN